jgi:hypothetical protein
VQAFILWMLTVLAYLNLRVVRMGFMVDKMAMGQDFLLDILFSPIRYLLPSAANSLSSGSGNIGPFEATVC